MKNYLYDKEFLKALDYYKEKQHYVRITALTNDEYPREQITGRASGGSINIDGASAVRRSCSSISLISLDTDAIVTDSLWCYNNKFKLEIGVKNFINPVYPEIIWFDMGIYIITNFSKSRSSSGLTVSISGKDKMCRLNGEVSGNIMMSTDFGTIEYVERIGENGSSITKIEKLPIYDIIYNAVKQYGQERSENIIINDLSQDGYELWEYRGQTPIYLIIDPEYGEGHSAVINLTFDDKVQVKPYCKDSDTFDEPINIGDLENKGYQFYSMNTLDPQYNNNATLVQLQGDTNANPKKYKIAQIQYGETAGYHRIELTYNSDLILNAGDTVTSLLDKLKNMLGDFEYFYDLQGRFVFQKKNTYIQELFSPINGEIITPIMQTSPYSYKFEDEELFTAISSSPNLNNLKNDFAIWGTRKSVTGNDLPIHARYAIDKKPDKYTTFDGIEYFSETYNGEVDDDKRYDWRELIYQMAKDFYKYNQNSSYLIELEQLNPHFVNGRTGYEQYYSDLQGFWRDLYDPEPKEEDADKYYDSTSPMKYWNKQIHLDPNTLNFWFDFLDTEGELGQYSINKIDQETGYHYTNIGARSKVVNENTVKSIYFRETPEVLFIIPPETIDGIQNTAYMPIWIQDSMRSLFSRSAQGASAISKANELIYQHTATIEGLSVTSIPIYYLQPNTRIYIKGYGDYTLDKIQYSLNYNGTMTLNGNKIIKQFY